MYQRTKPPSKNYKEILLMIINIIISNKMWPMRNSPLKKLYSMSWRCLFQRCKSSLILGNLLVLFFPLIQQGKILCGHLCKYRKHIWQNLLLFYDKKPSVQ